MSTKDNIGTVKITIDGDVVAQGRPRFSRKGGFVRTYDPPKSMAYKKKVKEEAEKQVSHVFDKPIAIHMDIYREVPKSWSKKKKKDAYDGKILPKTRPDLDNYFKGILDGLSGTAYTDDNIICEISGNKRYGTPRVEIKIRRLEEF